MRMVETCAPALTAPVRRVRSSEDVNTEPVTSSCTPGRQDSTVSQTRRLARSARRLTLHLPTTWPWQKAWEQMSTAANSPPLAA